MKNNYTDISIVLDRSGSMTSVATDTIGGFNKFLADQKAIPGECTLTLVQFDNEYEVKIDAKPIGEAEPLTEKTYVPRGSTALLDAIGKTINRTGKRLSAMTEDQRPEKVIFVILTDGYENASREFDAKKINEMITLQRDTYKWQFMFLGANQDAITSAANLGIQAHAAMTYANNAQGNNSLYNSLSSSTTMYRCGVSAQMAFSAEDRKKQAEAGA